MQFWTKNLANVWGFNQIKNISLQFRFDYIVHCLHVKVPDTS